MEYLGVGVCLVFSAILHKNGKRLSNDGDGWFVIGFMFVFGLFFIVIGGLGVVFDSSMIIPGVRGKVVLFVAYYYLLVNARVLSFAIETDGGLEFFNKKNTNIIETTRVAFSGDIWLVGRPYSALINFCQIILIVIVFLFIKDML